MKKGKKRGWLFKTIAVIIACAIVGVVISCIQFFGTEKDKTYASVSLQFSFDGAADGVAPNGYTFDIGEIYEDAVIESALNAAGLSDKYSAEDIKGSLVARGVYPEDIVDQIISYDSLLDFSANRTLSISSYEPTLFSLCLYSDFDESISQADLMELLEQIVGAYKADFETRYSMALDADFYNDIFNIDDYDYAQQIQIIKQEITQLNRYAQAMYEEDESFRYGGVGFNDICVRYNNLLENKAATLEANLTMNALTRNTERLLTQYQYEIKTLNNKLEKARENLSKMDELIESYDKNEILYLSTADSLTKIDGNSSETYDELVDRRKEVADNITVINSEISEVQLKIADLIGDEPEDESANAAAAEAEKAEEVVEISAAAAGEETLEGESSVAESAEEIADISEEELAAIAAAAQEAAEKKMAQLEEDLAELVAAKDEISADFAEMLDAYNEGEINDATVTALNYKLQAPKLLSGSFIMRAIKTCGPLCVLGFMVCLVLIIIDNVKKRKAEQLGA